MNTYLRLALVSLLALGLLVLNSRTQAAAANVTPLVVWIHEVGRAEAVQYDASTYHVQAPELRYFLTQFVVKHFSRLRATVQREYADSLFFLDPSLADATIAQNDQSRTLETFLTDASADEVDNLQRVAFPQQGGAIGVARDDVPITFDDDACRANF